MARGGAMVKSGGGLVKGVVTLLVVVAILFMIKEDPAGAGDTVGSILTWIKDTITELMAFVRSASQG